MSRDKPAGKRARYSQRKAQYMTNKARGTKENSVHQAQKVMLCAKVAQ